MSENKQELHFAVIPLKNIVVFPGLTLPIFIGRECSQSAIKYAEKNRQKIIFLVVQKKESIKNPSVNDIYHIGVYAKIIKIIHLSDNTLQVLVESIKRIELTNVMLENNNLIISSYKDISHNNFKDEKEQQSILQSLKNEFKNILLYNSNISKDIISSILHDSDVEKIINNISNIINASLIDKQTLLEESNLYQKSLKLLKLMFDDIEILKLEQKIKNKVKKNIDKHQKDYYLNEQLKAIHNELGNNYDELNEIAQLKKKIKKNILSKEAYDKLSYEIKKIKLIPISSAEYIVSRNYIETILKLPWNKYSKVNDNINIADNILQENHYGLFDIKEKILDYLSVLINNNSNSLGNILCLVGPPGVGKTSLARSIASALGRKYIRMSLGGLRDESEIKGHRKTYIGSMPGQIINKLIQSGVSNPLFLLDEIDKISYDYKSDPTSSLLEVLDPEQNINFTDNYLEINYDLSKVFFIATANSIDIPDPLLDRMEVVYLPGYTDKEKINIACKYIIPKVILDCNLDNNKIFFRKSAIKHIIIYYTKEMGVRKLKQHIVNIFRKITRKIIKKNKKNYKMIISIKNIKSYLGYKIFDTNNKFEKPIVGQVTGLAWTKIGGDILIIESCITNGTGKIKYTGRLGKVMQESIEISIIVVKLFANTYNIPDNKFNNYDLNVHVPEASIPKDGPSAGIAICTTILSSFINIPVNNDIAMTGEITLSGKILPVGGLKEKLLAAVRNNINIVLIPKKNIDDISLLPLEIKKSIKIVYVSHIKQVFDYALR